MEAHVVFMYSCLVEIFIENKIRKTFQKSLSTQNHSLGVIYRRNHISSPPVDVTMKIQYLTPFHNNDLSRKETFDFVLKDSSFATSSFHPSMTLTFSTFRNFSEKISVFQISCLSLLESLGCNLPVIY